MKVQELEEWFAKVELPKAPVMLDKFLESHFSPIRTEPDAIVNKPIWDRLYAFKLLIESNL
jgi:hypothetical protein